MDKITTIKQSAKSHNIAVTLLCDTNHYLTSDYSEVVYVGAGADAVDFKLISLCEKGDLVVTQDYGVAAMALSKGAYAIHLDVIDKNTLADKLYIRAGFKYVSTENIFYEVVGNRQFRMYEYVIE